MIIRSFFCAFLICLVGIIHAQPPSADSVLKEATATASKENKNVFIIFHASWCVWCHKMDSSMNDKRCKKFFDDNYIIRHLTVQESKSKKHLENPGATEMLAKYEGSDDGIPFWLIFDKNGNLLADSRIRYSGEGPDKPGRNSGCPATQEEVDYFISVLKKTSHLSASQLSIIEKRFSENNN
jgi:thiol-disulfide isomerase/thioredoxin